MLACRSLSGLLYPPGSASNPSGSILPRGLCTVASWARQKCHPRTSSHSLPRALNFALPALIPLKLLQGNCSHDPADTRYGNHTRPRPSSEKQAPSLPKEPAWCCWDPGPHPVPQCPQTEPNSSATLRIWTIKSGCLMALGPLVGLTVCVCMCVCLSMCVHTCTCTQQTHLSSILLLSLNPKMSLTELGVCPPPHSQRSSCLPLLSAGLQGTHSGQALTLE